MRYLAVPFQFEQQFRDLVLGLSLPFSILSHDDVKSCNFNADDELFYFDLAYALKMSIALGQVYALRDYLDVFDSEFSFEEMPPLSNYSFRLQNVIYFKNYPKNQSSKLLFEKLGGDLLVKQALPISSLLQERKPKLTFLFLPYRTFDEELSDEVYQDIPKTLLNKLIKEINVFT